MIEIQKMQAGKYYLIESTASANSVYFETDALSKLFFRYCNYYLKDFLRVEEYVLNKDGWAMLIKVKSAKTIHKHYEAIELNRNSKVKNTSLGKSRQIWWILSERVRLFISTYVRMSNKILGREGSLVRRNYCRYQFDNLEKAKDYVSSIRNDKHELKQSKKKYRGMEEHFRMNGNILTNPLRSSLWVDFCGVKERIQEKLRGIFGEELPVLQGIGDLVALNFKLNESTEKRNKTKPPKPQKANTAPRN